MTSALEIELRDTVKADTDHFYEHQTDKLALEMAAFQKRDRPAFDAHWARLLSDDGLIKKTILVDTAVAGYLVSFERDGLQEIGYWIGRKFWGRGVATAAIGQFIKTNKTRPLHAIVPEHNKGSIRALAKNGFQESERRLAEEEDGINEIVFVLR